MAQPIRVPNPARETIHPPTRGRTPVAETSPWHVAPLLWGLFALSLLFLGAVRMYVSRIERVSFAESEVFAGLPLIVAEGPEAPVSRHSLELRWEPVTGAELYHLRILTDRNSPVLDPVEVWTTSWTPSPEALPGIVEGRYRWSVEAIDSSGRVMARSGPGTFEVF